MSDTLNHFKHLLKQLSLNTGIELPLNDNACTLVDESGNEVVIIELPEKSDLLLLHRMLIQWPADDSIRNARAMQLLALNGEPDIMRGAWFCTDFEGFGIHLMTGCSVEVLTFESFEQLLFNFIDLAKTLSEALLGKETASYISDLPPTGLQV